MVIKKIFEGNFDEEVHNDFLKFGRGEYKNKYLLEGKKQAKGWGIKTGAEFANFLVRSCLEKAEGPVAIKGVIVSTQKLESGNGGFEFVKISNFQGVRKHVVDTEVEPAQIFSLMEEYPKVFFALSFKGEDFVLKIKAKAPKSGKPGKDSDEGPRADFCSLKTSDKSLVDDLFFGIGDFKEIRISHSINVNDIIYPDNMDDLKPVEIREKSKKKGVVIRKILIDGREEEKKAEFVA